MHEVGDIDFIVAITICLEVGDWYPPTIEYFGVEIVIEKLFR